MKSALIAFAMLPAAALAFNSDEWLAKREVLSREAERLQVAYTSCVARISEPAQDVTLPIERNADGSIRASVTAKKAQVLLELGLIWGSEVVVTQLSTNGVVEARVEADGCVIDRDTKSGWVEGNATMIYGDSSVKGRGIYFSLPREYIKILSKCEIRTKGAKFDPRSLIK